MPPRQASPIDHRLQRRVWQCGPASFDERSWTLSVDGRPVRLEAKPLEVLHELLLARGDVVRKDDLLDRIWPGVTVVEASLATAVHKLRVALGDDARDAPLLVTVPRVGYRLGLPVAVAEPVPAAPNGAVSRTLAPVRAWRWAAGAALLTAVCGAGYLSLGSGRLGAEPAARPVSNAEVRSTLRRLDIAGMEKLIALGWNPNTVMDIDGSNALMLLVEQCEWNPEHDRRKLVLMARTLLDARIALLYRNAWGDTAYSIAKADRFCGPRHPVTVMLQRRCYNGGNPPGPKCEARYDLATKKLPPA